MQDDPGGEEREEEEGEGGGREGGGRGGRGREAREEQESEARKKGGGRRGGERPANQAAAIAASRRRRGGSAAGSGAARRREAVPTTSGRLRIRPHNFRACCRNAAAATQRVAWRSPRPPRRLQWVKYAAVRAAAPLSSSSTAPPARPNSNHLSARSRGSTGTSKPKAFCPSCASRRHVA